MKNLDVEAVQAFVLVADLKSFTRAAHVLDTTQAAVSLRIKRLESQLGRRLIERTSRHVRLSVDGDTFLSSAHAFVAAHKEAIGAFGERRRKLVIGMSHHVVGAELPMLVRKLSSENPNVVIELRIAASRDLLFDYDKGILDAAIVLQYDSRRLDGQQILKEEFGWMASADFQYDSSLPLKLATQAAPCSVRQMAIDALDEAGVSWEEVFVGGGVATIGAAVAAGVAVAALGRRVAPAGTIDIGDQYGLPRLPGRDVVCYSAKRDEQTKHILRGLGDALRAVSVR